MAGQNKQNPLLAAFEAKLEAEYMLRFKRREEISLIAHILSCHEDFGAGPGRAEKCICGYLESQQEVAEAILAETKEDPLHEFPKIQRDLAKTLKSIMGPDLWKKYQYLFPMLQFYWD